MVKNLFTKKAVEPDDLRREFYQIWQEPIILPYTNLQRMKRKEQSSSHFMKLSSPRCKNPGQNFLVKRTQQHTKHTTCHEEVGFTPGMQDGSFNGKINGLHHIN